MISDDSGNEDIDHFTINEHFAKAYEYRKEREELQKLKEKYGSDGEDGEVDDEDSEEDESEDENGEELTPAVDAAILRTLARIRRKDPSIYENEKDVFEEERQKTSDAAPKTRTSSKDESKPLTIRQHALASALNPSSRSSSPEPVTHAAEQAALRKETISAFHGAVAGHTDSEEDNDEDDFLVPREKTKDEIEREEEEYREFLQREVGDDLREIVTLDTGGSEAVAEGEAQPNTQEKKKKRRKGNDDAKVKKSKEEGDQEFLMNYILNRGWIDRSARRLPTYNEIVGSKSKKKDNAKAGSSSEAEVEEHVDAGSDDSGDDHGDGELDEDDFEEVADRFESAYNFRFEEPGAPTIARYPRNIDSLVRRQDTTRKEAREKRKARKEEEMVKKREEVKRLKSLKMKDLQARLEKIGKEGGKTLESKALQQLDVDGDWDPDAHDRQMAELYEREAGADAVVGAEKPTWDDDIDITDIVPPEAEDASSSKKKKKKKRKGESHADVDDGAVDVDEMDAALERRPEEEGEWDGTEETRKRALEKYMDELYELEFNDMVGDFPTRFKYTRVVPQAFGLAPAEILMATDAELNTFMGIKKYAPYRKEGKGRTWDGQRTARLKELRDKLKERGVQLAEGGTRREEAEKLKKRKGKKERMREKATTTGGRGMDGQVNAESGYEHEGAEAEAGRRVKRRKVEEANEAGIANGAEGGNAEDSDIHGTLGKKKRRRHKKVQHVIDDVA